MRILTLLFALLLLDNSLYAQEKRVLVIGIDGLVPDAVGTAYSPNMNRLFEDGAGILLHGYTEDLTFSGPSWSTILHGVHRDRHGVTTNQYDGHDFSDWPGILERIKQDDPNRMTAAFVTWPLLRNNFRTPDERVTGVDRLVYRSRQEGGDEQVTRELVRLLREGDPSAIFYYQNDIDGAGHGYGFYMDRFEYRDQVRETDARIGRVLDALEARPGVTNGEEEWLVILVTDHGGVGTGHSGNLLRQRTIPMIVRYEGLAEAGQQIHARNVDVGRTVLSFMGIGAEELDGRDLLDPSLYRVRPPGYGRNLIRNGDGTYDRGFRTREFDQVISGWTDQEMTGGRDGSHSMTLVQAGTETRYLGAESSELQSGTLFTGGIGGGSSRMVQNLSLAELEPEIDRKRVGFRLSGWLGAEPGSGDRMELAAWFRNDSGEVIGSALLQGRTPDGGDGQRVLEYHETSALLPPGTRSVEIELLATGQATEGVEGVRAYADRLCFVLEGAD